MQKNKTLSEDSCKRIFLSFNLYKVLSINKLFKLYSVEIKQQNNCRRKRVYR